MAEYVVEKEACGCEVMQDMAGAVHIEYCPKHKAAPEMHDALKEAKAVLNTHYGSHHFTEGQQDTLVKALRNSVKALAKAEGK